eukprot:m.241469 g.241469  ORF g.241469 m.241469 type:complete len:965 (-) comp33776_c0_seq1:288-3182(-)
MALIAVPPVSNTMHTSIRLGFVLSMCSLVSSITIKSSGLSVELDNLLPRPSAILHTSTNTSFTPPASSNVSYLVQSDWWDHVSNYAIDAENYDNAFSQMLIPKNSTTVEQQVLVCTQHCTTSTVCLGWNLIKVTSTSGQRDSLPLCLLYNVSEMPTHKIASNYRADPNFECGSKSPLAPEPPNPAPSPPPPPQPSPPGGDVVSKQCVSALTESGEATTFCAVDGQTATIYDVWSGTDGANWSLITHANVGTIKRLCLNGTVQVTTVGNISELIWTITSVSGSDGGSPISVRAIDLEFAFVGLDTPGDTYYFTSSTKTWCPPDTGCQEWDTSDHTAVVLDELVHDKTVIEEAHASSTNARVTRNQRLFTNQSAVAAANDTITNTGTGTSGWEPPTIPWAHTALVKQGRSNSLGGWKPAANAGKGVGVGVYSTQRTLPFQLFRGTPTRGGGVGLGSARINLNLRCGSQLPQQLRFGFFTDITGDGKVDADDSLVYTRNQYPVMDYVYRAGIILKLGLDYTSYETPPYDGRITFDRALDYIQAIANMSDNMLQVTHLVGWQGSGHDTLYPSYNQINPLLGASSDLQSLVAEAEAKYNTIVSYHINTDEAYWNYTACEADGNTSVHPVPGTNDGQHNPDCDPAIISTQPNGNMWPWQGGQPSLKRTDHLQGPAYHISKTKDAITGQRWRRLDAFRKTVPVSHTVHMDAYRDIDTSFENDTRGYIAEDEEMACGCAADHEYLKAQNLSLGVEGSNGMASVGGQSSPAMDVFNYYWHGSSTNLAVWGRMLSGSDQGLDSDVFPNSPTDPFTQWESLADKVYLKARPLALRYTDTNLLSGGRFSNGGDHHSWPHPMHSDNASNLLEYFRPRIEGKQDAAVFIPQVVPPRPGSAKSAPTTINPLKSYVYLESGAKPQMLTWTLPSAWVSKHLLTFTITPSGSVSGPSPTLSNGTMQIMTQPGRPIVIIPFVI